MDFKQQKSIIELAIKEYKRNGRSKRFIWIEDLVIKSKDPLFVLDFAELDGADLDKLEEFILAFNNPDYIIWFGGIRKEIEGIDKLTRLTNAIANTKNASQIYTFALQVRPCVNDMKKLYNALLQTKDKIYIERFEELIVYTTNDIEDALNLELTSENLDGFIDFVIEEYERNGRSSNFIKMEEKVLSSEEGDIILNFAKSVEDINNEQFEDAIIKIGHPSDIYEYALEVEGANIQKLEEAVISHNVSTPIYKFAKNIPGANIEKLEDAICKTNDAEDIYNFARYVKKANIKKLQKAIIKTKNIEYIVAFGGFKNLDREMFENDLIKLNNAEIIYKYAYWNKKAGIKKLYKAILLTNDMQYIAYFEKDIINNKEREKMFQKCDKISKYMKD